MNPLMFISLRLCQSSSFAVTSRAITPSLGLTSSSDSDNSIMRSATLSWALDSLKMIAASGLYLTTSSSWWLLPIMSQIQDSRMSIMHSSIVPSSPASSFSFEKVGHQESTKKRRRVDSSSSCSSKKPVEKTTMSRQVSDGSESTPIVGCSQNEHAKEISLPSAIFANISHGLTSWAKSSATTTPSTKKIHSTSKKVQHVTPDLTSSAAPSSPPLTALQLQQQRYEAEHKPTGPYPLRRVNSNDWVKDYKKERIDKINFNNVFGGIGDASNNEIPVLPEPHEMNQSKYSDTVPSTKRKKILKTPSSPGSSVSSAGSSPAPPLVASSALAASSSTATNTTEPNPTDVICGRGGRANSHPGNISFRAEAQKLRSWYESSSKSEKFTISSLLVDFVREKGGRFLKRDAERPGNWLEADANDVRKKASQALREGRKTGSA